MKIIKTSQSRLSKTDFSNLPFGRVFSDHMLICNFKNNKWQTPEIVPYGPIEMTPATQALHYGQSIFEGMKAFKNDSNEILLFRKKDNLKSSSTIKNSKIFIAYFINKVRLIDNF